MKRKKWIVGLAVFVLVASVAERIVYVNASARQVVEERYDMHEWVDLDGAFHDTAKEQTQGYSVRVNSVELTSYSNYIAQYNGDDNLIPESSRPEKIIDVEVTIKNTGNTDGHVMLFGWGLQTVNDEWVPCVELWSLSQPNVDDNAKKMNFVLKPDSEYTMSIPYKSNGGYEQLYHTYPIEDQYGLVVSRAPVKKIIHIPLI